MATRLIITGFMGSGKSTVGRLLARKMKIAFVDTDDLVEKRMGMSINDAFAREGEEYFRAQEEAVIESELGTENDEDRGKIISLGGGAVTIENVGRMLQRERNVFFLDVDVDTAFQRSRDGSRPLARDRGQFERLYESRRGLYRQYAGTVVAVGEKSADVVAEEIIENLGRRKEDDSVTG